MTEKFFQALVAGTIPVVYGAPNIHIYEPRNNSIVSVADFSSLKQLATRLKEIAGNEELYQSMLAWKSEGPSDQFKALMDYTSVHSECRLCIRIADDYARQYGDFHNSTLPGTKHEHPGKFYVLVREQHTYYFRYTYPVQRTLSSLYVSILQAFEDYRPIWVRSRPFETEQRLRIYSIHHAYATQKEARSSARILGDLDVMAFMSGQRLEVVFV